MLEVCAKFTAEMHIKFIMIACAKAFFVCSFAHLLISSN